ncbi:nucleoporin isoform X2 [Tasmannia lanceolata]|uniref:nucleoporin isoform X2 n=1 Tax=Tasmannia lanceolata TaxID=3420 RepID=UPI0040629718
MQEADRSGLDQCDGNVEGSHGSLQDRGCLEIGYSRIANETDSSVVVSETPDVDEVKEGSPRFNNTQEADPFSVPAEATHGEEGPLAIKHEEKSASQHDDVEVNTIQKKNLEDPYFSQDFSPQHEGGVQEDTEQEGRVDQEAYKQVYFPEGAVVVDSKIIEGFPDAQKASVVGGRTISLGKNAGFIDLYGLAKVLGGLEEEEVRFLLKLRESASTADLRELASVADLRDTGNSILPQGGFVDGLECLKQQLYLTNVAKDFLHLQLAEQSEVQMEFEHKDRHLLDEVSKLRALVEETQESNTSISEELMHCRLELRAMASGKEEVEIQCLSARAEVEDLSARACRLQNELEQSQEEVTHLSDKLADCKGLLGALEIENANLKGNLILATEERRKFEEEKEFFSSENKKLTAELLEHKDSLVMAHDKQVQLEDELKEAMTCFEQLTKDNICLSHSLDIHKEKVKEIDDRYKQLLLQAEKVGNQLESSNVRSVVGGELVEDYQLSNERCHGNIVSNTAGESVAPDFEYGSSLQQVARNDLDGSVGLLVFKGHLEETERIVQNLEKAIQAMHSHSISLSRSGGKMAESGVSKLILAFESKVHHDETVSDEVPLTEEEQSTDSFKIAKEHTFSLLEMLKQLNLDAEKANEIIKEEQDSRRLATTALKELEVDCETQKQQNYNLESKNNELVKKLTEYQSRTDDLQSHIYELQQNADEKTGRILNQVEYLQKEVGEKMPILENERSSLTATVSNAVEKLDMCIRLLVSPSVTTSDNSDVCARLTALVNSATNAIEGLHEKLEAAYLDHGRIHNSYEELNEKLTDIHGRKEVAVRELDKIYGNLQKLVNDSCGHVEERDMNVESEELLDLVPSKCETLFQQLRKLLDERQQLQSARKNLESELINKTQDIEELNKQCLDLSSKVMELSELQENMHQLSSTHIQQGDEMLILKERLNQMEEALEVARSELHSKGIELERSCLDLSSKVLELSELQENMHQLSSTHIQQGDEMLILKERLNQMEEALEVARSELHSKGIELEQSEQRLSSVREKLSIAVAKGKGLIVQRDSLKQSLAEKTSEVEKCFQELQSKEVLLHEVEAKLKAYSEAGERVEALESELSYIRNSAAALRESFLLKDSVLQRIEEILEDLELPEHFHSRDIFEKIEWLARSATGNSLPLTDWDQKSSVGGSYSDGGFVVMDTWKEDSQLASNPEIDDLRRKYDELQSKFYGLAEHNDMLEQSLVERNNLVQRWEEILDRIDIPFQLRSMEPEDRIEWLGRALSEAQRDINSFKQKIENLEISSESILSELEESQKKSADLKAALVDVTREKELFSENLEKLTDEKEKLLKKVFQVEVDRENLCKEMSDLQEKLAENLEKYSYIENEIAKLQGLVNDALPDQAMAESVVSGGNTECLEGSLRKLIDNYTTLSSEKSVPIAMEKEHVTEADESLVEERVKGGLDANERDLMGLKEELDLALANLAPLKEERNATLEKYQSLILEVEAIRKERDDLQERVIQEEQKTASAREKLNIAVRKGKGLVQQRDSMKQTVEEMNTEVEQLKHDLNQREKAVVQYEQKVRELSTLPGKVEALESENLALRSRLEETEHHLQDGNHTLSGVLTVLNAIDVGGQVNFIDPVQKIEGIGKLNRELHAASLSSEREAMKSKRAAELLLAELNEVQERADSLQEELIMAESARVEANSNLEQFIAVHSEERKKQHANLMKLKDLVDQLRKEYFNVDNLLANCFSKDLELLYYVESGMESFVKQMNSTIVVDLPHPHISGRIFDTSPINEEDFPAIGGSSELKIQDDSVIIDLLGLAVHGLQECMSRNDSLKRRCHTHSINFDQQAIRLPKIIETIQREITFQEESSESIKQDITRFELLKKEKDSEINMMRRNITLLYEACISSISEIENREAHMVGQADGGTFSITEECVRTMADDLLSSVKGLTDRLAVHEEGNQKELKATILHLQKELQEKDIQRNRICAELVTQIKEAETTARSYLVELDFAKNQVHNLEQQVEVMKNERDLMETRVNELKYLEASSEQLQERIKSLTGILTAKEQEIEDLMQALDEEETQMAGLASRNEELEKIVQEKNLALESVEVSRGKAMAKLATTVSKFNELHQLSESLISEVENLQSQLKGRDSEISFLRQEVTRCTTDVLASKESKKKNSTEVHELLTWLNTMVSRFGVYDVHIDDQEGSHIHAYTEILEKHITSAISELDDLRLTAQRRDGLLQAERSKVEELLNNREILEISLQEKESQLELLQGGNDSGQPANLNNLDPLEAEPMRNKRPVISGSIAPLARSVRKVNNDQVAIAVDVEAGNSLLDDEDDDKAHGFKSLTLSRIVPRATRPVTDRIDGLWVSVDRMLMRQPTLRLGIIMYWIALHALLATSIV